MGKIETPEQLEIAKTWIRSFEKAIAACPPGAVRDSMLSQVNTMQAEVSEYGDCFSITPFRRWYDLWIGLYIEPIKRQDWYFCVLTFGIKIHFPKR